MRAHFIADLEVNPTYVLTGNSLHHLFHVVRIEVGEQLLLLNGSGLFVETQVESVNKREIHLRQKSFKIKERSFSLDLALGMPKREALELCLKECTELGFRKIYLIRSDYSQMRFPDLERTQKLLISALEQSNAPFLPEVIFHGWDELPFNEYENIVLFDSQTETEDKKSIFGGKEENLLVVGPEGGFSSDELKMLHSLSKVNVVNLPTPILRTPTAVATGAGFILQSLLK